MIADRLQKFMDWCDKAMAFSFYALIYFLPISIALSETFTGLALLFYVFKRLSFFFIRVSHREKQEARGNRFIFFFSSFKPPMNDLSVPILIFLLFNLISVIFSRYPILSIEGFFGKVLQSAFLYFNFIEAVNSKKRLRKFLIVFLISATLISINGLYQYFVGKDFIHGHLVYDGRISSSFRAHNDFAAYLIVIIPIFFSFFYPRWKETRQVRLMVDTVLTDDALDQREKELYPKSATVVGPEHKEKKLNIFEAYVEKFRSIR